MSARDNKLATGYASEEVLLQVLLASLAANFVHPTLPVYVGRLYLVSSSKEVRYHTQGNRKLPHELTGLLFHHLHSQFQNSQHNDCGQSLEEELCR